jgi:hypothetical protein
VNNTVARLGTVLAVAVIGVVTVALYGRALDRGLAHAGVSDEVARAVVSERRSWADVTVPESVAPAERATLVGIVHDAFLASFRGSVLLCAGLALLGAALAAVTIAPVDATARGPDETLPACVHVGGIADVEPRSRGCDECLRTGDTWVHLRVCLSCGQVGCCDSSKNHHATKHFWATGHAVVRSLQPGETWRWCYVDERSV